MSEGNKQQEYNANGDINKFIAQICTKNYAEANKYLQAALETKLKSRIAETQHKLGF